MEFLDVYCQPLLGYTISSYLTVEEEMRFDATCTDVRTFNREYAYPMYREVDLDALETECENERWASRYLTKISPYLQTVTSKRNELGFCIRNIARLPKLRHLTYAIPLTIDVTLHRIHPNTYQIWSNMAMFVRSLGQHPNQLESLRIVPGIIRLVRADPITSEYMNDEYIIEDRQEGSHLAIYRRFGMPVVIMSCENVHIKKLHAPSYIMALATKKYMQINTTYTDWDSVAEGIGSYIVDLLL